MSDMNKKGGAGEEKKDKSADAKKATESLSKPEEKSPKKMNSTELYILLGILAVCLIGAAGYFLYKYANGGIGCPSEKSKFVYVSSDCDGTEDGDTSDTEESEDGTEAATEGNFKAQFSYPSEFVPPVKLCFEKVGSPDTEYCFYTDDGSLSSKLPVGKYNAYMVLYRGDDWGVPSMIVMLNSCTTSWAEADCADYYAQKDLSEAKCDDCGLVMSSTKYNATLVDTPTVYEIKSGETLDMGTVDAMPLD